jgi:hypothetical protein
MDREDFLDETSPEVQGWKKRFSLARLDAKTKPATH